MTIDPADITDLNVGEMMPMAALAATLVVFFLIFLGILIYCTCVQREKIYQRHRKNSFKKERRSTVRASSEDAGRV
jgi:hypothetical protein